MDSLGSLAPLFLLALLCVFVTSAAHPAPHLPLDEFPFAAHPQDGCPSSRYGSRLAGPRAARSPKLTGPGSPSVFSLSDEEVAHRLDAFIPKFMDCRRLPAVQIALVRNGSVIYQKGFGIADANGRPVDSRTLFGIGSTSKAFTALAVAMLAAEPAKPDGTHPLGGGLDTPVRTVAPEFELKDAAASAIVSWRDLLSHRTGLARHDQALMVANNFTQQELLRTARYLQQSASIRSKWIYNNWMVAAAGYLAAQRDGRGGEADNFAQMLHDRILQPLGMLDTHVNYSSANTVENRAHVLQWNAKAERFESVEYAGRVNEYIVDRAAPAGSINSNAVDMAQWVKLHLGVKTIPGVTPAVLHDVHKPAAVFDFPEGPIADEIELSLGHEYGAGWTLGSYRGRRRVAHNGQTFGYSALVSTLPDDGIGLFLVSNSMSEGSWYVPLAMYAFDLALGLDPLIEDAAQACSYPCPLFPDHPACAPRPPPHPTPSPRPEPVESADMLVPFEGTYREAAHGTLSVTLTNSSLTASWGVYPAPARYDGPLRRLAGDLFAWDLPSLPGATLGFRRAAQGTGVKTEGVELRFESNGSSYAIGFASIGSPPTLGSKTTHSGSHTGSLRAGTGRRGSDSDNALFS